MIATRGTQQHAVTELNADLTLTGTPSDPIYPFGIHLKISGE